MSESPDRCDVCGSELKELVIVLPMFHRACSQECERIFYDGGEPEVDLVEHDIKADNAERYAAIKHFERN